MSDFSILQSGLAGRLPSRSLGVKLIVVCGLALLMSIPTFFVWALVEDRTRMAEDVVKEVSGHVGGQQTFLGPTLAVPYTIPAQTAGETAKHGTYLIFPVQGSATMKVSTEERRRSLFKVPVYQADMKFNATFDLTGAPAAAPPWAQMDWSHAEMVVGVSDARGALADATLAADGKTVALAPAESSQEITIGADQGQRVRLTLFGQRVDAIEKPGAQFEVSSSLRFSGAQRIALLAYGKTTHLTMQGDWPSPGFDGGFLPVTRNVANNGFSAEWSVPFIARGVRAEGASDMITGLDDTALGVSFVELADPYQSVYRSLKYLPLFVGLVFLSYFIFEVTTGKRVHPAQYLLVGVAQIIFYLLLLSLAERVGFDIGFLIAGGATVSLLAANAGWVFASRAQAVRALGVFSLLYALIYTLLRLEDNALLIGAIASFAAVAAVMYFTRKVDWYGSLPGPLGAGANGTQAAAAADGRDWSLRG
jgi:inner membrane protein